MLDLNEFKQDVHANAVEHGWWDKECTDAAVIALIHAEISEALEEWRGRYPMVYHMCINEHDSTFSVCEDNDCHNVNKDGIHEPETCPFRDAAPHGVAVELIDVILRALDLAAAKNLTLRADAYYYAPDTIQAMELPALVVYLHYEASVLHTRTWYNGSLSTPECADHLSRIVTAVYTWLRANGVPCPDTLLREKHAYNRTRPYKHGGKRI